MSGRNGHSDHDRAAGCDWRLDCKQDVVLRVQSSKISASHGPSRLKRSWEGGVCLALKTLEVLLSAGIHTKPANVVPDSYSLRWGLQHRRSKRRLSLLSGWAP